MNIVDSQLSFLDSQEMLRACPPYWPGVDRKLWWTQVGVSDIPCLEWAFVVSLLSVGRITHQEIERPEASVLLPPLSQSSTSDFGDTVFQSFMSHITLLAQPQDEVGDTTSFTDILTDSASAGTPLIDKWGVRTSEEV